MTVFRKESFVSARVRRCWCLILGRTTLWEGADRVPTSHLRTPIRSDASSLGILEQTPVPSRVYFNTTGTKVLPISWGTSRWHVGGVFCDCQLLKCLHGLERTCQKHGEAEDSWTEYPSELCFLCLGLNVATDQRRWCPVFLSPWTNKFLLPAFLFFFGIFLN